MVDADDAGISVYDHGLLYGDGVFEGIRFYDTVPFRLDAHLKRLQRSARALHLDLPYSLQQLAGSRWLHPPGRHPRQGCPRHRSENLCRFYRLHSRR